MKNAIKAHQTVCTHVVYTHIITYML